MAMFDQLKFLFGLFNRPLQSDTLRERCLNQMLRAYCEEAHSTAVIDHLEKDLSTKLRILPVLCANVEFAMTLEGAILSLKGRLLAFSAVAIILLSLSAGLKFQNQGPVGLDEVATYNIDLLHRDSFLLPDEMDYAH
jgi:hypothetical protein